MMKQLMQVSIGLVYMVTFGGCAAVHLKAEYRLFGTSDPDQEERVERATMQAIQAQSKVSPGVHVLVDAVPEGISWNDGSIGVKDGYRHQVLGKFILGPDHSFFPNYQRGWKKGVCYPQQVLTAATMGIWMIVPTYYPCFIEGRLEKGALIRAAKQLAQQAGGDAVVLVFSEYDRRHASRAAGFLIKLDPRMTSNSNKPLPQHKPDGGMNI